MLKNLRTYFFIGLLGCDISAFALPAKIIIVRHAEKAKHEKVLNTRGLERAAALAPFLIKEYNLSHDNVAAIYASRPSQGSVRSLETCTPTATALHLSIDTRFATEEYAAAAQAVLNNPAYDNKIILMCWTRVYIPKLAKALGANNVSPKWHKPIFDRVWVIHYDQKTHEAMFEDLPQHLLKGDDKE